ncbi:MAG: response regulator [Bacteroidota bacterium]|jgi:YesN/AraC family two-component response regulator
MTSDIIICVDDERSILEGLNQQLNRAFGDSFLFEFAQSGEEALELIEELNKEGMRIAFLVTDQMMTGMNGNELIKKVETVSPQTKCILLTGYAESEIIEGLSNSNLLGCLPKPWESASLIALIQSGIGHS